MILAQLKDFLFGVFWMTVAAVVVFAAQDAAREEKIAKLRAERHANEAITTACVESCRDDCAKTYWPLLRQCGAMTMDAVMKDCRAACSEKCAKEPR